MTAVASEEKLAKYEKILAKVLRCQGAEQATARELLQRMEQTYPGIREKYIARTVRRRAEASAKDLSEAARQRAEVWAKVDPLLQSVIRMGQGHLANVIDAALGQAEGVLIDLITPSQEPPQMPPEDLEELLEEHGSINVTIDDDEDPTLLCVDFEVPREVWRDKKLLFAWLREGVTECLVEIDSQQDPTDDGGDDEDDDDDAGDDDEG